MKTSHAVVICLIIFAIFSYTAATLTPLVQQDNLIVNGKAVMHNSLKGSPKGKGMPCPTICGDPIEDPTPETH